MDTSKSTVNPSIPPLSPVFDPNGTSPASEQTRAIIEHLKLQQHPEGGYFAETDRDTFRIPNPFALQSSRSPSDALVESRSASTSIYYFLTPKSPFGAFHRNRGRTVHTLHKGRGRYIIIHADEVASTVCPGGYDAKVSSVGEAKRWVGKARVETFVVGQNVLEGERLQWIVEGGKYKCSFLLPDEDGGDSSDGLLISETVIPGFEYADHDFMKTERMEALVTEEQKKEMEWMVRKAN